MRDIYKIAVIEDDLSINTMLETILTREGYAVIKAFSGTEALLLLEKENPDLILLDLMLPGLSGEELLPKIKNIPVIVLSAKTEVADKVGLLMGGAVDYVTKPFAAEELLARIVVQLRKRENVFQQKKFVYDDLELKPDLLTVTLKCGAQKVFVHLTRTECAILKLLMQNPKVPVGRTTILDRISEDTPDCTDRSLKQHISNLRKKLQAVSGRDYIEAVYGIGFMLK